MPGGETSNSKALRLECTGLVPVKRKREYFLYSYICQRVEREEDCCSIGSCVSRERREHVFLTSPFPRSIWPLRTCICDPYMMVVSLKWDKSTNRLGGHQA